MSRSGSGPLIVGLGALVIGVIALSISFALGVFVPQATDPEFWGSEWGNLWATSSVVTLIALLAVSLSIAIVWSRRVGGELYPYVVCLSLGGAISLFAISLWAFGAGIYFDGNPPPALDQAMYLSFCGGLALGAVGIVSARGLVVASRRPHPMN